MVTNEFNLLRCCKCVCVTQLNKIDFQNPIIIQPLIMSTSLKNIYIMLKQAISQASAS